MCHRISVFLVTEAGWGSPLSNQVHGRCGFVMQLAVTKLVYFGVI